VGPRQQHRPGSSGPCQPVWCACRSAVTYEALIARIHPEDRFKVKAAHQQAVWSKGPYEQEYRVVLPDGSVRWIMARGEVVCDDHGQPTALAGITLDITRRKQAEIALAQRETELAGSERRFRGLADAMPQMVWSTRPDGHHDYYNQRWYEFTGVPEGSTDGEAWNGMFHPDDQERAWAKWRHSLTSGEPYEIEYRLRHRSGEYRWVLGRALPMRNEQGEIERWFGTCTDIHDLKLVQQALAESEEFTRRLLSSSDDCIKVLDLAGHLRFMSEGGQRVMEVSDFCQIEGCHWPSFWTGSAAEAVQAAVETAKAGGTGRFQGFCPTVAGTPRWWDVLVTAIKGPDGRPERLLSISRDITEHKQAEDRMAETAERYRLAARATNDAIWDWDLAADHAQWNEAVQTLFGYAPEEIGLSGQWWKEHIHPEDRERVVQDIHAIVDGQETHWSAEYRFQKADGTYAAIFDRGYVLRDETGRAVRMIGAMLDITERKRLEEQQVLVSRELHHRVKNSLATVQAVISSTARHAQTISEFRQAGDGADHVFGEDPYAADRDQP
jgi:PAS domain S-box-containing protein